MIRSTTILCVRHKGAVAMAGDGQVTLGRTVLKHTARKVRVMRNGKVLGGFAGSAADGLALFERFEARVEEFRGNLRRAAVEMARDWRADRVLRRLQAMLLVADTETILVLSGTGEVVEPDHNVAAIGSGAPYALAAARALTEHTDMSAADVARRALEIAAEICIYTNREIVLETL
ncbi:MAG TPA: ATP-dependent protease subunit HslV [Candidatus Nitrosotenuis sp.]|jgi:ATP-dependent HslUV protease subunit HslV|nr:ATP-dependent protease subunit HslV [Candidatus Nitrosotenuis sp.]